MPFFHELFREPHLRSSSTWLSALSFHRSSIKHMELCMVNLAKSSKEILPHDQNSRLKPMRNKREWTISSFLFKRCKHICLERLPCYFLSKVCQSGLGEGGKIGQQAQLLLYLREKARGQRMGNLVP